MLIMCSVAQLLVLGRYWYSFSDRDVTLDHHLNFVANLILPMTQSSCQIQSNDFNFIPVHRLC